MSSQKQAPTVKLDYGIDGPPIVGALFAIGMVCVVAACFHPGKLAVGPITILLTPSLWSMGISSIAGAILMVVYAKWWKFHHRDRMMALVAWRGDEMVLDVGTGRGLLMIAAAHRLTSGRAVGIDIWSAKDLSGNAPQNTLRNAELEGVGDRVEIETGDATKMRFADDSFDVVLSNLCIHNIPTRAGRKQACEEIMRVLKPGGRAVISDFIYTGSYASWFRAKGAKTKRSFSFAFPPLLIVEAQKPPFA